MRVLVTGARGFIGSNLIAHLERRAGVEVLAAGRETSSQDLQRAVASADFVFHLAGVNRAADAEGVIAGNRRATEDLCGALVLAGRPIPVLFASSTQAALDNLYGASKRDAEARLRETTSRTGSPLHLFRLPNVFGKWARPDHNSVVATFCHRVARGEAIRVDDPSVVLTLVHIDDVVDRFIRALDGQRDHADLQEVGPSYRITVGDLAATIAGFRASRDDLTIGAVGVGLARVLYSTYVSYLPPEAFRYPLAGRDDSRGRFVEVIKTGGSGQFSYFSALPGATRGGHFHHVKTEKFVVLSGTARFRFRDLRTGARHELVADGTRPEVVETIPGWTHDITNVGPDVLLVMLWANETFDRGRPDTYAEPI